MRRLLAMEKTNGIWTQKMLMKLDRGMVNIMDNENKEIVERFPIQLVREPTAFTSNDPKEIYNNILIYIVGPRPEESPTPSEMHIFQCVNVRSRDVVEDLKHFMNGSRKHRGERSGGNNGGGHPDNVRSSGRHSPDFPEIKMADLSPYEESLESRGEPRLQAHPRDRAIERSSDRDGDETSSTSSDKYEKDVAILNRFFDDIEKFIARLQHSAAAFRELEKRRRSRKSKKKDLGDGMLSMRAKPPPEREFVDIFQKFKLSFNLLAKLKAHIHDPNAPELVHFLFTPLALIVDASHDSHYGPNLPSKILAPLPNKNAVDLLINCLTSKESELWHSLGEAWYVPREQWKGYVPPFKPVFMDGWSPAMLDDFGSAANGGSRKYTEGDDSTLNDHSDSEAGRGTPIRLYREDRATPSETDFRLSSQQQHNQHSQHSPNSESDGPQPTGDDLIRFERAQRNFMMDLMNKNIKLVQVTYPRTANNEKELSVTRGEYLEVLDDTRKWWKTRNIEGQIGHVPHTIVTPVISDSPQVSPHSVEWIQKERRGKKGEFRYF